VTSLAVLPGVFRAPLHCANCVDEAFIGD